MSTPTPRTDEARRIDNGDTHPLLDEMEVMEHELNESRNAERLARVQLGAEREKVRVLHSALQNLADEQNGAPLERRREEWQEAMDEAIAALDATEDKP